MTLNPRHLKEIQSLITGRVLTDVPLSRFTSLRIGGPADLLVEPLNKAELAGLLRYLHEHGIGRFFLGAGTNVLFSDKGLRGVVIRLTSMVGVEVVAPQTPMCGQGPELTSGMDHDQKVFAGGIRGTGFFQKAGSPHILPPFTTLRVQAGEPLPSLVTRTTNDGLQGLEKLCGVPGSFGGAVVTNAGAAGGCMGDLLVQVELMGPEGECLTLERQDLRYGYRYMQIPNGFVVTAGTMAVTQADPADLKTELERIRQWRRASQPLGRHSAGCIFKNPRPDKPAGLLIERQGLKGTRVGDAQVSEVHANFIINRGSASAAEILELIELIRRRVGEAEGLDLELEVRVVGEGPHNV